MNKIKEKDIHSRRTKTQKIVIYFIFAFFILYTISMLAPFAWTFLSSLKSEREFSLNSASLPSQWLFVNYIRAFSEFKIDDTNFIVMTFNSLWLAAEVTIPSVFFPCMLAYAVSKYKFKASKVVFTIALIIAIVPTVGSFPALYVFLREIKLINNPLLYWVMAASGLGMNFFLFHAFFSSLSWSYAESGFIDGASNFQVMVKIMIPMAKPLIVALLITGFIGSWNDYLTPFLYMNRFPTVALGVYEYNQLQIYHANRPILFCGIMISLAPVLLIFSIFSKTIMNNMMAGGLKG